MGIIPEGLTPMILIFSVNHVIVGAAPLKTRKYFAVRQVDFLNPSWCSEFIFDEQYRNTCFEYLFDFLFNTLKLNFASFILPGESQNIIGLREQSELRKIHYKTTPIKGRRIIPITSTWTEFEAKLTRNFKKELRRTERNLNKIGSLTKIRIDGKEQSNITEHRILRLLTSLKRGAVPSSSGPPQYLGLSSH